MPAAAVVTIILAVVVVLVLAFFLLATARVLARVNTQLAAVIDAVGTIATRTEPVDSVVRSINSNLATARDVLSSLLVSKVGSDGAADLIASVDPLAQGPSVDREAQIQYEREYEEEPYYEPEPEPVQAQAPEPPPAAEDAVIHYERAGWTEPAAEPPWEQAQEDEPAAAPAGHGTADVGQDADPEGYDEQPRLLYRRASEDPGPAPAAEPDAPEPEPVRRSPGGGGGKIRLRHPED